MYFSNVRLPKVWDFKMLRFLLLVARFCEVCGGPLDNQKTAEIQYDEGYINLQKSHTKLVKLSETALDFMDKYAVDEGDILLPSERNAVNDLWPVSGKNVSLPYKIDSGLENRVDDITDALKMISNSTCIKFHLHTNENDYLYFLPAEGCASFVGCVGGEQPVLVGPSCKAGNICHEILHSLGLYHEHSRHDRDKHITILYENIIPGKEDNFLEKDGNTLGLDYDYDSILHYGNIYFSNNGKPTIVTKDSTVMIGQRTHLSVLDVQRLRKLYRCDKKEVRVRIQDEK